MIDRCILLIEEDDESRALMAPALRRAYPRTTLAICSRVEHAWQWIRRHHVRCYFICSGTDELGFLQRIRPFGRIILHAQADHQNEAVINRLEQTGWSPTRCHHLRRGPEVEQWGLFLHSACGLPDELDDLWVQPS